MAFNAAALTERDVERFWSKVAKSEDGCWLWQAGRFPKGYGAFSVGPRRSARTIRANRVAWVIAHGRPIPDGLVVRHTCDVPACVRPDHLVIGTTAENNADIRRRGRKAVGERSGTAKLTAEDVIAIRVRHRGGASCRSLALEFGVHPATVERVVRRKTWAHLAMEVAA